MNTMASASRLYSMASFFLTLFTACFIHTESFPPVWHLVQCRTITICLENCVPAIVYTVKLWLISYSSAVSAQKRLALALYTAVCIWLELHKPLADLIVLFKLVRSTGVPINYKVSDRIQHLPNMIILAFLTVNSLARTMCPPDSGFMKLTCRPIPSCNPKSILLQLF